MCSAVVSSNFPTSDFWIISPCKWESEALTHLIKSFGLSVSKSGELREARPSSMPRNKLSVILAVIGKHDEANGVLLDLFTKFPVEPIVLLMRNRLESFTIQDLPSNVMAAVEAPHPSAMLNSVLTLVASGHRVLASGDTASNRSIVKSQGKIAIPPKGEDILTRREKEVSREISLGKSNKDIARRLGISLNTVNAHTAAIRQKLGVHNRTQIALQMSHLAVPALPEAPSLATKNGSI